jgi:hypothetical protein
MTHLIGKDGKPVTRIRGEKNRRILLSTSLFNNSFINPLKIFSFFLLVSERECLNQKEEAFCLKRKKLSTYALV